MYFCGKPFKNNKMKYKVGDKVKYDGGDWWFYGTVSAVFEHSICPCYRLSVERMEKKSCKFSITQFEFELEAYHEEVESGTDKRKWDNTEIEYLKKYYGVLSLKDLSKVLKRTPREIEEKWWQMKPESEPATPAPEIVIEKPEIETSAVEPEPEKKQRRKRKQKSEQEPETEKQELKEGEPEKVKPAKKTRGKRGEAWQRNLEMYKQGERSNIISTWMAQNRREYKTGKLPEKKLDKLLEINFPFEVVSKKKTIAGTND